MRTLAIGLGLAVWAHVAHAQAPVHDKEGAQKAYRDGQLLYNAGDYRGAADRFKVAYASDPDPVYLYNLAQADRFAKLCSESADAYRRFLAAAPTAPNRDKVQRYVDEMDACAKDQGQATPAAPATPVESNPTVPVTASPRRTNDLDTLPAASPRRIEDHRGTIYTLGGAGVLAAAVGIYFTHDLIDASNAQSQCETSHACDGKDYVELDNRGSRDNWAVPISFGIAAAAIGTATWVYLHDRSAAEHSVAVAPTRGGAVVAAEVRF